MSTPSLGALLHAFLADELPLRKGLRATSIKAHRDALRLFVCFIGADVPCRLTQITLETLTLDRVLAAADLAECVVELEGAGRRMRIQIKGMRMAELVGLSRIVWADKS